MLARLLVLVLTAMIVPAASAADYTPQSRHQTAGNVPTCETRGVLRDVTEKAAYRGQSPYQDPVAINGYEHIRQTRHIPSAGPGLRERRWCQARAHLASGHTRSVYYLIESHASFVGISYGVESCMAGRDLWNVHGGDCNTLRHW